MRASSAVLACLVAASSVPAQQSTLPDSVRQRVDRVFAGFTQETPGCGVGINRDGKPTYARAFGMSNLEYGIPLSEQTVFESGSVAKQFTAGAIVLLALDGKLTLEDDVRKYIPEVPVFPGGPITIRMLLNHTSGLRDQWGLLGLMNEGPGQHVHSPATTIDLVAHQKMLNFPPGTRYLYSNTGYVLLGVIVERVSGKSLEAFSQERLFKPLGMTNTQWRDDYNEVVKNRATAYGGRGTFRTNMPITNMIGNGGLLFTVADMMKWLDHLDNPTVLGAAWRDSLQVRGKLKNGTTIPYALGLTHGTFNGTAEISHSGSTAGYQTWVGRFPEQKLAIAVLCNLGPANPTQLARQVAEIFIPRPVAALPQSARGSVTLTPADVQRWVGIYREPMTDGVIRFTSRDGVVAFGDPPQLNLSASSSSSLYGPTVNYVMMSNRPKARRVAVVRGTDSTFYDEVAPADTSEKALREYVGTYESDELGTRLGVTLERGRLMLNVRPLEKAPMRPVYKDGFEATGSMRFTRDKTGKITGFAIFAGRVLDVRFKKISSDLRL